jgi:hypothetical protein
MVCHGVSWWLRGRRDWCCTKPLGVR